MSVLKIKPNLIDEMQDYGSFDVNTCFNCGTCTATCPLVKEDSQFPRMLIRLAQLGQSDKLIASKELWACYYCGDCSASCPREADPAEFMMASRRYAIANYDVTGISKSIYKNKLLVFLYMLITGIIITAGLVYADTSRFFGNTDHKLMGGYYYETIHYGGLVFGSLLGLVILLGVYKMYRNIDQTEPLRKQEGLDTKLSLSVKAHLLWTTFWETLINEGALQKRFKREDPSTQPAHRPSRWVIHMTIVWGFVGLAAATALDYLVKDLLLNDPAGFVPIWYPIRLLGIVSGLLMLYGTSYSLYFRWKKVSDYYNTSNFDDWLILTLIWFVGLTGFLATLFVYLPQNLVLGWINAVLIIHVLTVSWLFMLLPFTKFGHMMYRPLALWIYDYQEQKIAYAQSHPMETPEPSPVLTIS